LRRRGRNRVALMARVLHPNQAVTMQFNGQRLNLSVEASGRVIRVNCG
ncbi:MAG: starvation-inducible protein, partial [Comamonadaceae bacterium]